MYYEEKNLAIKEILYKILIYIADEYLLEKIALDKDLSIAYRTKAIRRINDGNFLILAFQKENDPSIKKVFEKEIKAKVCPTPDFMKEKTADKSNSSRRKVGNDTKNADTNIDDMWDINELRSLAIKNNPAKRIADLICETKNIILLRYFAKFKSSESTINLKEWTDMIVQLPKEDAEIAKRIEFDKPKYKLADILNIKNENELSEIALESTNENILFRCVDGIKNEDLLEKIFHSSKNSTIRFHIIKKIDDKYILWRLINNTSTDYLCAEIVKKIDDKNILIEIEKAHKTYWARYCAKEKLKQIQKRREYEKNQ